jgi:hypothetical protein
MPATVDGYPSTPEPVTLARLPVDIKRSHGGGAPAHLELPPLDDSLRENTDDAVTTWISCKGGRRRGRFDPEFGHPVTARLRCPMRSSKIHVCRSLHTATPCSRRASGRATTR